MPNAKVLSEKQAIVAELTEKIQKASAGVLVDYKGITVEPTILAKGVFVGFIIFFLSIAIRNVTISYHTMQTSQFFEDKVSGYVTVPVNTSNASMQNLNENYKAFYSATVNRWPCSSNLNRVSSARPGFKRFLCLRQFYNNLFFYVNF